VDFPVSCRPEAAFHLVSPGLYFNGVMVRSSERKNLKAVRKQKKVKGMKTAGPDPRTYQFSLAGPDLSDG